MKEYKHIQDMKEISDLVSQMNDKCLSYYLDASNGNFSEDEDGFMLDFANQLLWDLGDLREALEVTIDYIVDGP